jgi:hypothetical protein
VLVFWATVNVLMNLFICVLYNDIANSLVIAMSKEWLMSDKLNGRKN